ncbi:SusC/RagA family TonB-linked outer membrane protein [Dyadobacter pollutisoli]|uniref:TonB-dependent receptor n=1 Tax=Dyadobacter pollutisoli TaxID=2910158 RepID=A0A9E8SS73_9BACT|nr:TonB-dependent receptor [Dyadobacter pollutisoli]WAC15017.1 TonB-dependent receptor [Dyadobacter pollutisoli]
MIKRYRFRFLFLLLLMPVLTFAQQRMVTGTVLDSQNNQPLPGVNVINKGTTNGTSTDNEGRFSIQTDANTILVFSYVGYASKEVLPGNQTQLKVSLDADAKALSEMVVIGYGTVQKKDLTGAVSQVSSKDFNAGINPNPLQAIQGKVAGLNITQPSGDPNQSPTVRLRGYTSLAGGSEPLYVVDGVIGIPINSISPSDIDRIDVLKDASASAIYGSRAANGVVIITTKRGQTGKSTLTFNNYVGMETISKSLDLMNGNEYREQVQRIKGPGSLDDNLKFPKDQSGNGYNTDWMKQISRTGYTKSSEVALSGGSDNFSYRGSLNYVDREGIIKNTGFNRVTGRINVDQKALNEKLKIQYNLTLSKTESDLVNNGVINRAVLFLPTLPVRNPDGTYYEVDGSFDLYNPVAMQNNFQDQSKNHVLIGSMNLNYDLTPHFSLGANGAYRYENTVESQAYNMAVKAFKGQLGEASRSTDQHNDKLLELTAKYNRNFGSNSSFNLLGGYSYQEVANDGFGAKNNIGDPSLEDIDLYGLYGYNNLGRYQGTLIRGQNNYATSFANSYKLISFFGRTTFNLLDKFNVTATLRRDGSSKFGANNKWGLFPSIAGGWTVSNEAFMAGNKTLNYLKLRAGWGRTGNSEGINPYNSLLLYGPSTNNYYDPVLKNYLPGVDVIQNSNPDLKWEVLSQVNLGLDFELFNGKLSGTLEVYDKRTNDMLYNYSVAQNGVDIFVGNILKNVGQMSNKGVELSLGGTLVEQNNFRWRSNVVGSVFKNKIVRLSDQNFDSGQILYNNFDGRGLGLITASELREGRPLGEFYVPKFAGFDQDGNITFESEDGGQTADYSKAKKFESGLGIPKATVSWTNNLAYKNFDLSFQLRGVFGNKILNNLRSNLTLSGSVLENNMIRDISSFPANYSTPALSDYWLESGAFVRLDNWQVGYNIPGKGLLRNARVYVGGNNLFVLTKYTGVDPELAVNGTIAVNQQQPASIGVDSGYIYPKTRSFQLGINLSF